MQRELKILRSLLPVSLLLYSFTTPSECRGEIDPGRNYFSVPGLDVIVFDDIYPDGHQTGVTIIQHGRRVAANGDLRLEPEPGQWSPMPVAAGERTIDAAAGTIRQSLHYPDPDKNGQGFNPIFYPDLKLDYTVTVAAARGDRLAPVPNTLH